MQAFRVRAEGFFIGDSARHTSRFRMVQFLMLENTTPKHLLMKRFFLPIVLLIAVISFAFTFQDTPVDPWKPTQVIKPADLAKTINDPKAAKPVIINVGPMGQIKGAVATGAAHEDMAKFKTEIVKYKKDQEVVVYCGCCSMANCPNIRLAFDHMKTLGYTKPRVLEIQTGLTEDWSGKGYPMQ